MAGEGSASPGRASEGSSLDGEGALCALPSPCRDSLLLETGFLAVLVAPLRQPSHHKQPPQGGLAGASPHEGLPFWLVRWLLFRLMFASGVVKLTSRCPTWWGLTGEDPRLHLGQSGGGGLCPALTTHRPPQPSPTTTRRSACPRLLPGLPTTCPSGYTGSAWWPPSSSRSRCPICSSPLLAAYAWLPSIPR